MEIISKVLPVVLMVLLGFFCSRRRIIPSEGSNAIKTLVTTFMLPVLLFNALATASYNADTVRIVAVMLAQLCVTFAAGMLIRRRCKGVSVFLPFLVCGFEGGMIGYPLYSVLCGEQALANIATVDIANTLFVFTVFLAFLTSTFSQKTDVRAMAASVFRSPVFWGVALGVAAGASGLFAPFASTAAGSVYLACEEMLTSAVSACILIVVGYDLDLNVSMLRACGKAVLIRLAIQVCALCAVLFALRGVLDTPEMQAAVVLYAFMPPTYIVSAYARKPADSAYISTTLSLYTLVSLAAFVALSFVF